MTESQLNQISYRTLIDRTIEYLIDDEILCCESLYTAKDVFDMLQEELRSRPLTLDTIIAGTKEAVQGILEMLERKMEVPVVIENLEEYIRTQRLLIDKEIDTICLVVDRDRKSFFSTSKEDQYAYVLETCRKHSMNFYITNPCFEFWLLMHFDEVHAIYKALMLENPKESSKYNYAQKQLKNVLPRYTKDTIRFDTLCQHVDRAIENERSFCEDIVQLEHEIGSTVGLLIRDMKHGNRSV